MHESYKKWLEDGKPEVICKCGCNGKIVIKEHHKWCGIPLYINGHFNRNKHPSKETKQKQREKKLGKYNGENNPMWKKHHTKESKQKNKKSHDGQIPWNKGLTNVYSENTLQKMRESQPNRSGENNPNWKDASTPLNTLIRNSNGYLEWRLQIFGRDNFTCQCCGIRGTYLEVHHIKPFNEIIKEYNIKTIVNAQNCEMLWDLNNGITYCTKCHDKLKKKGGILESI